VIYLATRLASPPIPLPLTPVPWWTLFDASEDDLIAVCTPLLQLYKDWGADPAAAGGAGGAGQGEAVGSNPIPSPSLASSLTVYYNIIAPNIAM